MFHDDCRILASAALQRTGFLTPGFTGTWQWEAPVLPAGSVAIVAEPGQVTLRYRLEATGKEISQRVRLDVQPCKPTRGERWLWLCPTCGRRCMKLYGTAARSFRCSECMEVGYRSLRGGNQRRMLRRASQLGPLLEGAPVDGVVPPPCRARKNERGMQRMRRRDRMREALAKVALELLRED
jgi:hypothetical protein